MKIIAPLVFASLALFFSLAAFGAQGGHQGAGYIPLNEIGWQAANFGLLLIAIYFFVKKSIVTAFRDRKKNYLVQAEKTKSALNEAALALAGVKQKLTDLEADEKNSIIRAEREAAALSAQIISEAVAAAEKIKKDTKLAIDNEVNKARAAINQAILSQALAGATKSLLENSRVNVAQEMAFVKQIELKQTERA